MNLFDLYAKLSLDDSDYTSKVRDAGDAGDSLANKLKSGLGSAGGIVSKGLTVASGAAVAFGGALLAVEANTEEYRAELGRLDTAYEAAGYSTDTARQAFSDFYGILGETDTAVEASQLLAKLSLNEQDMATWTDIAAGVWGTFGQSLPIEGLIESANETAKVGVVTGSLADALNWAGISEDEFNAKLAECGSEAERNQLIMETLSGEYSDAADAFKENNAALIESRENQLKMQDALAKVGGAVTVVKNKILSEFMPAITNLADVVAGFLTSFDPTPLAAAFSVLLNVFVALSPAIMGFVAAAATIKGLLTVVQIVNQVKTAFTAFFAILAANPFMIITAAIIGLISVITTLWMTNENFRNAVIAIWEQIKQAFVSAWEVVSSAWGAASAFFSGIASGIQAVFAAVVSFIMERFQTAWNTVQTIWGVAVAFFSSVWAGIQAVFSVVAAVIGGFFSAAWAAVQAVWSGAVAFFSAVWAGIQSVFSVVVSFFSQIFSSALNAVKSAWNGAVSYFSGIWNSIKNVFASAYSTFLSIGSNMMQGLISGIQGMVGSVMSTVSGIVSNIKSAFTEALSIHSPSRWAAWVGQNTVKGLSVGMLEALPEAKSTAKEVAEEIKEDFEGQLDFASTAVDAASKLSFALKAAQASSQLTFALKAAEAASKLSATVEEASEAAKETGFAVKAAVSAAQLAAKIKDQIEANQPKDDELEGLDDLEDYFGDSLGNIDDIFAQTAPNISQGFVTAWETITETWDGARQYFFSTYTKIKGVFSNSYRDFYEVGERMMNGWKMAVKIEGERILDYVDSLCSQIASRIQNALDAARAAAESAPASVGTISMGVSRTSEPAVASAYSMAGTTVNQYIQTVPQTPVELARQSVNAFDRLRWR